MIEHGASINFVDKICTIRINDNYPYIPELEQVVKDLRESVYARQYFAKCLIHK